MPNLDPDFWRQRACLDLDMLTLMAIHGHLCLALRHPEASSKQAARELIRRTILILDQMLLDTGAISAEELAAIQAEHQLTTDAQDGVHRLGGCTLQHQHQSPYCCAPECWCRAN